MNILDARRRLLGRNVYKKTVEGSPISVRSLARMRPGLSVMGKSTQKTTTGAQLLDLQDSETSSSGISYIVKDGAITATGTSTATAVVGETILSLPNGTYYASGKNGNLIFWIRISYSDDKPVAYFNNTSFNVDDTVAEIIAYAQVDKGKTVNNAVVYPMLNAGSSALPWEPYTGGRPSPSPDYPQVIENAGDDRSIQVDVLGGNLYDSSIIPEKELNGVTSAVMDDGGIRLVGETSNDKYAVFNAMKKKDEYPVRFRAGKMTVSISSQNDADITRVEFGIRLNSKAGTTTGDVFSLISAGKIDRTLEYDGTEYEDMEIILQVEPGSKVDAVVYVMLNYGDSALPFEPYKQPQSLTIQTPNGLPGIPVGSGGNYTDENGQQWICDEIDFKRGKYVQRVAWVTFDGSDDEPWVFDLGGPNNLFPRGRVPMYGMCSQKLRNRVLCNRKIYSPTMSYDTENTCFSNARNIYIYGEKATAETDTEWRQELSEKPVTVLYELETPIETDLTEEQMAAYANLYTNRPTTVVSATDGAGLELTYKTKKSLEVTA